MYIAPNIKQKHSRIDWYYCTLSKMNLVIVERVSETLYAEDIIPKVLGISPNLVNSERRASRAVDAFTSDNSNSPFDARETHVRKDVNLNYALYLFDSAYCFIRGNIKL